MDLQKSRQSCLQSKVFSNQNYFNSFRRFAAAGVYQLVADAVRAEAVTAGTGDYEGKVKISYDTRSVQSNMNAATTDTVNDNQYFYNGDSNEAGQVYLTLCEVDEFSIGSQEYSGEKISVQNLEDGKQSIILLNRRGYHTFVRCSSCHEVVTCPNCSIGVWSRKGFTSPTAHTRGSTSRSR